MSRANPDRQTVLAAAGVSEDKLPTAADFDPDLPADLEFDPVPRRAKRSNGLTSERQRIFIAMLAQCGSVRTACRAVGCSDHAIYHLRNSPGAESFAAAWDKAVERGARRILDVLVDQAINGTPEYFYKDGQIVGERRHFNTRAMMWIVAHNFPEKYGVTGGLMHSSGSLIGLKRLQAKWKAEGAAEAEERSARYMDPEKAKEEILKRVAAVRRVEMVKIAANPEKRAAYELLHGPQDCPAKQPSLKSIRAKANERKTDDRGLAR